MKYEDCKGCQYLDPMGDGTGCDFFCHKLKEFSSNIKKCEEKKWTV